MNRLPNELLEKIANYAAVNRMTESNTFPFKISAPAMKKNNEKQERKAQRILFKALFSRKRSFRPRK